MLNGNEWHACDLMYLLAYVFPSVRYIVSLSVIELWTLALSKPLRGIVCRLFAFSHAFALSRRVLMPVYTNTHRHTRCSSCMPRLSSAYCHRVARYRDRSVPTMSAYACPPCLPLRWRHVLPAARRRRHLACLASHRHATHASQPARHRRPRVHARKSCRSTVLTTGIFFPPPRHRCPIYWTLPCDMLTGGETSRKPRWGPHASEISMTRSETVRCIIVSLGAYHMAIDANGNAADDR